jgi:hypothetical protein
MKTRLLVLTATVAALTPALPANDFVEFHQRMFDHLKTVRDTLVPAPLIDFVEGFPPVAIPRAKILHLAQADAPPPNLPAPDVAVDTEAITDWANNFAITTTQRTLDGLFPRSAPKRPLIVGGAGDAKANAALEEDLTVMMRILEKAAGGKDEEKPRAMGIDVFSFGRGAGSTPRVFYIQDYGAMFVLNVRYPLLAPPKKDDQSHTNEPTSSEWEKAREEVYGRKGVFEEFRANAAQAEEFDSERVENLKQQIVDDLANATHIKGLKPDDYVTVVVQGGGPRGGVVRREVRAPRGGGRAVAGGGGGVRAQGEFRSEVEVHAAAGEPAAAQSTMTLRAKKSDIDSFAKGKLQPDEFRKKVSVQLR